MNLAAREAGVLAVGVGEAADACAGGDVAHLPRRAGGVRAAAAGDARLLHAEGAGAAVRIVDAADAGVARGVARGRGAGAIVIGEAGDAGVGDEIALLPVRAGVGLIAADFADVLHAAVAGRAVAGLHAVDAGR